MRVMLIKVELSDSVDELPKEEQSICFYFKQTDLKKLQDFFFREYFEAFEPLQVVEVSCEEEFPSEMDAHKYYLDNVNGPSYHNWPILILDDRPNITEA